MAAPMQPQMKNVSLHDPTQMKKIAEMAYHLWEKRGRPHGSDMQDWVAAEKIVMGKAGR